MDTATADAGPLESTRSVDEAAADTAAAELRRTMTEAVTFLRAQALAYHQPNADAA